jgi:hypothetical protein
MAPTASEKIGIVNHLWYEVRMLRAVATELAAAPMASITQPVPSLVTWAQTNALVEAMALHARNLIDFFYTPARWPTDVVADDLVANVAAWTNARPPKTALLIAAKPQADKQVSHLTYDRVGLAIHDRTWLYADLVADLNAVLTVFLQHADPAVVTTRP